MSEGGRGYRREMKRERVCVCDRQTYRDRERKIKRGRWGLRERKREKQRDRLTKG